MGFGRGLTVTVQAASNPQGRFYAADFNPAHVAGARQLAEAAGLGNLTLLENSFSELADGKVDLPQFDFITLHGIYSWVGPEIRRHICAFIARYLKPGGIVFTSYNAMPGWATGSPMQRLLLEHAKLHPGHSPVQLEQGRSFIAKLMEAKAAYFQQNPNLQVRWNALSSGNANYLVHEYLNDYWEPLYHADVARDMADAKLGFVGSAELAYAFETLYLNQEKLDLLKGMAGSPLRETVKDFILNTSFRKDVYVRGARALRPTRYNECLNQFGLALLVPRGEVSLKLKLSFGEINAREELYGPVLDALAQGFLAFAELAELPVLKGKPLAAIVQVVSILIASGQVAAYPLNNAARSPEAALALNRALTKEVNFTDDYQALASSLLGNGVQVSTIDLLICHELVRAGQKIDPRAVAMGVWQAMVAQGRRMTKDGKNIDGVEENIAEVTRVTTQILKFKFPIWQQLKIL